MTALDDVRRQNGGRRVVLHLDAYIGGRLALLFHDPLNLEVGLCRLGMPHQHLEDKATGLLETGRVTRTLVMREGVDETCRGMLGKAHSGECG